MESGMAKTSSMYIRIDPLVKTEVEAIYKRYGMSLTDAINIFIYQSRNIGGLPFNLRPAGQQEEGRPMDETMPSAQASLAGMRGKYKGVISTNSFMEHKQLEKRLEL